MASTVSILAFGGSLRKASCNKALLRAAKELVPEGATLEIFEIAGMPAFNEDHEKDPPAILKDFKASIRAADAVLIATPEYNYSVPGFLKNAIDCATRPYGDNPFDGKPVAVMGGSAGTLGTARAQYHLRQTCVFLNMHVLNRPEVMVPKIQEKVDAEGRLTDKDTRDRIRQLLEALIDWARLFAKGREGR